jgi:hypothetical protein
MAAASRVQQALEHGDAEAWVISALAGPAAEALHYGNAAVEGDLKVIQRMAVDLGLSWSGTRLDEFRQRARDLVVRERRATAVLAANCCSAGASADDEIAALLPDVRAEPLWV